MTYVLKSDATVVNPAIDFDYITDLGLAKVELKNYYEAQKANGFTLTQTFFDALNALIEGIKTEGVWDNIIEFMPLLGNSLNTMGAKVKYLNNANSTSVASSIPWTASNLDGNIGVVNSTNRGSNGGAFGLGVHTSDLVGAGGFGSFHYAKANPAMTVNAYVAGCQLDASHFVSEEIAYISATSSFTAKSRFENSAPPPTNTIAPGSSALVATVNKINSSNLYPRKIFINGVLVDNFTSTALNVVTSSSDEIYLGAINIAPLGSGTTGQNFFGQIRFYMMHDGSLSDTNVTNVSALINTFLTATGKTF